MAYYYANHAGMQTLQMPFCPSPPPPPRRSPSATPADRAPPTQADVTYAATAAMRAAYRRPQSIQITVDTPYYDDVDPASVPPLTPATKRRREGSPELRHASMSPRPDRQRVRMGSNVPRVEVLPVEEPAYYYYDEHVDDRRHLPMTPASSARHSRSRSHTPHVIESVEKPTTTTAAWEGGPGYSYGAGPLLGVSGECDYHHRARTCGGPLTPFSRSPSPSPPSRINSGDSVQIIGSRRITAHTPPQEDHIARELSEKAATKTAKKTKKRSSSCERPRPTSTTPRRRHELSDREYDADCGSAGSTDSGEHRHSSESSSSRSRRGTDAAADLAEKRYSYADTSAYVPRSGRYRADTVGGEQDGGRGRDRERSAYPPLSGGAASSRVPRSSSVGVSVSSRGSGASERRKRDGSIGRNVSFRLDRNHVVQYEV